MSFGPFIESVSAGQVADILESVIDENVLSRIACDALVAVGDGFPVRIELLHHLPQLCVRHVDRIVHMAFLFVVACTSCIDDLQGFAAAPDFLRCDDVPSTVDCIVKNHPGVMDRILGR